MTKAVVKEKAPPVGLPRYLYDVYFRLFPKGKRIPTPIVRLMEPYGWKGFQENESTGPVTGTKMQKVKLVKGQSSIMQYVSKNVSHMAVGPAKEVKKKKLIKRQTNIIHFFGKK